MHPIQRFIKTEGINQRAFARLVKLSPQYINDLLKGRCRCGPESALQIERKTNGKVKAIDLVLPAGRKRRAVEVAPAEGAA